MKVSIQPCGDYQKNLSACLDEIGAGKEFRRRKLVWIKPNLINAAGFPITTDPGIVRALLDYIQRHSRARIVIAEGCGDPNLETSAVFEKLGYTELAMEYGADLVDLNTQPLKKLSNPACEVFPELYLPKGILSGMLVSVPVLKRHSLAQVTLAMKNMLGLAPPSYYQEGGSWKKSAFHSRMQRSIFELNLYRSPDLSIIDASVGMAQYHLGGPRCSPPVEKLVAGFDPVAVDAKGAELLGLSWRDIGHIRMAHSVLGSAEQEF